MRWPQPVRVVGVGSPHGDDALAWELVRRLESQMEGQTRLEFHVVEGGQRLLDLLDGRGSLLLVDALAPAGAPGTIHRFEWPDPQIDSLRPARPTICGQRKPCNWRTPSACCRHGS